MPKDVVTTATLTRSEQSDLLKVIRGRERVAKSAAAERAAELKTDFEAQISRIYDPNENPVWDEASNLVKQATKEAGDRIDAECERLGIPKPFRPSISCYWNPRRENALAERRAELRRLAYAQIEEAEKRAKTQIERISVQAQTDLLATGLSASAKAFLETLPSVDALMPTLNLERVEQQLLEKRRCSQSYLM